MKKNVVKTPKTTHAKVVSKYPINQPKLNLACGKNKAEGYFGVDKVMIPGLVDAVVDLTVFPWPIKSDSVEDAICSHYVEHIPMDTIMPALVKALRFNVNYAGFRKDLLKHLGVIPDDGLIAFMEELNRIMKKGAIAKIISPYWSSVRCWQDPTHRRAMNEATFLYFNKVWREANGLSHYQISVDMDYDYSYGYDVSPDWTVKAQETKDFAVRHYTNVVMDIHYLLTKR